MTKKMNNSTSFLPWGFYCLMKELIPCMVDDVQSVKNHSKIGTSEYSHGLNWIKSLYKKIFRKERLFKNLKF